MSERRFRHALDDAALFRVSEAIGGLAWPAYAIYGEGNQQKVVLDVDGSLVEFFATDVIEVARPENLPNWVLDLVVALRRYEDFHGHPADDWTCFAEHLEAIPGDVTDYVNARKQVSR